jgi:hypothetical protein
MSLSQRWSRSWFANAVRSLGNGVAGASLLAATAALTAGCLDRPVAPATPDTTNIYIGQIRQTGVDKIDLLFMIDNSISMADKQRILADAVPVLLERLIRPVCVNNAGNQQSQNPGGGCNQGYAPEFKAVDNIHIGIITSSLGHHGSKDVCSDATAGRTPDDKAQLLPSVRATDPPLAQWNNKGFLVWDPRGTGQDVDNPHMPPGWGSTTGPGDANALVTAFTDQVEATGELGCGYEQQLEAWYRFLVDPEPVDSMDNDMFVSIRGPVNPVVLNQRADFLRRDSLLAIVMLTDENDCSILDENNTQGWLVGYKGGPMANNWRMPASTESCKQNPNSACCRPCISTPASGCGDNAAELCPASGYLTIAEDSMNQRCFNQMKRFGINLLYPTYRYTDAITSSFIDPRMTGLANQINPLFAPGPLGEPGREKGLVFLAGIVGVPWQDIATDGNVPVAEGKPTPPNSLTDPTALVYLTASQLTALGRWDVIVGQPSANPPVAPTDPLMQESIDPRSGPHPFLPNAAIVPPGGAGMNPINGREQAVDPNTRDDLQFACIFDLEEPVPCNATNAAGCDCNADEQVKNSPLCMYGAAGMDGTQIKAKAYPGLRELEVLRGVGDSAIVASICPKNPVAQGMNPAAEPYYGYNPAVAAIVDRLKDALTAKCLPRPLTTVSQEDVEAGVAPAEDLGKVPCAVVEARPGAVCGECTQAGRLPLEGEKTKVVSAVKEYMKNQGQCGGAGLPSCDDYCMCEIQQFTGDQLYACKTEGTAAGLNGYCYVDPAQTEANSTAESSDAGEQISPQEQDVIDGEKALVANCKETERRVLRFLGDNLPAKDGLAVIACVGAAVSAAN